MIICMHVYEHRGWAQQQRVSTTFFTQKNFFFLVLLTGFERFLGYFMLYCANRSLMSDFACEQNQKLKIVVHALMYFTCINYTCLNVPVLMLRQHCLHLKDKYFMGEYCREQ